MPPITTADHVNEHRNTAAASGLVILMDQGYRVWWINEQYRMHPSMLRFPNEEWYGNILTNASHTSGDSEIRQSFGQVFLARYRIDLSEKEDGKGSQFVAVDVPKGFGLAPNGSSSLENYASARAIVSVVAELLAKPAITSDKVAVGVWYKKQGNLIQGMLADKGIHVARVVTIDSFQGHDIPIWLCDLTGTAHSQDMLARVLESSEQSVWQSISAHLKSPHRLNVALTRAKDGLAVFGNFRSIARAVRAIDTSKDSSGKPMSDFIADAGNRDLMVIEDANPALKVSKVSAAASLSDKKSQERQLNLEWMGEHREKNATARKYDMQKSGPSKRVTYAGRTKAEFLELSQLVML